MLRLSNLSIAEVVDLKGTHVVGLAGGVQDVVGVRLDDSNVVGLVDTLEALEDFAADLTARLAAVRADRLNRDGHLDERIPGL